MGHSLKRPTSIQSTHSSPTHRFEGARPLTFLIKKRNLYPQREQPYESTNFFLFMRGDLVSLVRAARAAVAGKPNIVLVFVDNFGNGDLGCFGSTLHRTPNIDRLAVEGRSSPAFTSRAEFVRRAAQR